MGQRLTGKRSLVTGAAEGLGRAVALRFLAEGSQVILTDIQGDKVVALAAELGPGAIGMQHDVSLEGDWRRVLAAVEAQWGGFDTLINNAGISVKGDIEHTTFMAWKETCAVDLDGAFLGCHLALPQLKKNSPASIVNVSSALAVKAHMEMPAYSAAKAGVEQMTRSMALYCARSGYAIRCNLVQPGSIMTPMQERVLAARGGTREGQFQKTIDAHPIGRVATPDEVANAILFLASDEASFVTGACIAVDGGLTL